MNRVEAPIESGVTGEPVSNLRAALLFLLQVGAVKALEPPNKPTAADLAALFKKVSAERAAGKAFDGDTLQLVFLIQLQHGIGDGLQGTVDEATAALLNRLLEEHGVSLDGDAHVVTGRVTNAEGLPRAGLTVVADEHDLFADPVRLGDGVTDDDGHYRIAYSPQPTLTAEGLPHVAPDIQVHVLGNNPEPLATSPVHFNVGPVATIDLVVPAAEATEHTPIEFDEVTRRVMPMLGDRAATEIGARQIEFIVGDTGLAVDAVKAWVTGARLQADALALLGSAGKPEFRDVLQKQGWPFGHAWQRNSGIGTLAGLLASGLPSWEAALDSGAARRWIGTPDGAQRKMLLAALAHLQRLAPADPQHSADPMVPRIAAYLRGVPPGMAADALRLFREQGDVGLEKILDLGGGDPEFHEPLARLVQAIRVHDLAEGHQPLIEPLMARLGDGASGLGALMPLQLADWQALAHEALASSPEAGGLAYRMLAAVEQQAPAQALLTRLEQDAIVPRTGSAGELRGVVAGNQAAVELVMKGGIEQHDARGFVAEFPEHASYLSDLGVYSKIGVDLAHGSRLMDSGFSLSGWLTQVGQGKAIGPWGPEGPLGAGLHPQIGKILADIRVRFKGGIDRLLDPQFSFIGPPPLRRESAVLPTFDPLPPQLEGISSPTVRGMFGDLDTCVCRPCESVLGPAAYLVELLRALQLEVTVHPQADGLRLLQARRPDILELDLGCDNAEVPVPHIDLALEQLEWLAAQPGLLFASPAHRPVADWLGPPLDPALIALLHKTSEHSIDPSLTVMRHAGIWLLRESGGGRSWWIEPIGPGANGPRGWRVAGMAIRRSAAVPDPLVSPAERNPQAYAALTDPAAVFPWTLPFDAGEGEQRALFDALGIEPLQLGGGLPVYDTAQRLDRDTLGLTAAEEALLLAPRTGDALWQAWGFANGAVLPTAEDPASGEQLVGKTPGELLARASFLLARSGLSLDDLEQVLATRFVGRYGLSNREQCQTSLMLAQRAATPNPQPIDADALDRVHRFTRLRRRLPAWSIPTLDSALRWMHSAAGTPPALGAGQLRVLAAMERARRALGMAPDEVLALRCPLSDVSSAAADAAASPRSVFAAIFLGRHVPGAARAAFEAALGPQSPAPAWDTWRTHAAAALAMQTAEAVLPAAAFGASPALTLDALEWLFRHHRLATALGRPIEVLLLLLRWCGWGEAGLGTAGDPLDPAGGLAARAEDFDRLAGLRQQADLLAQVDLPLQALAAAQIEALQQRAATNPQPAGSSPTAALRAELLALRAQLAAVPFAAAVTGPGLEQDELVRELVALSWDAALVEQLRIEIAQPPAGGLSADTRAALIEHRLPLPDPRALIDETELRALLDPQVTAEDRFRFLLDRVLERRGAREQAVAERLAPHLGGADARSLLQALRTGDSLQRKAAAEKLAVGGSAGRRLAQVQPLLQAQEVDRLVNPAWLDSWRSRLDMIDTRLAEREREGVLLEALIQWARRRGVEWHAGTAESFLADRLTVRGARAPGHAKDDLLGEAFHTSQAAAPPAALLAWLTHLDTVLALQAHSAGTAALLQLAGLDWRTLLDADDATSRMRLPLLLWLADANRLGLPTLTTLFDPGSSLEAMCTSLAQRLGLALSTLAELASRAARLAGAQALQPGHLRDPAVLWRLYPLAETARRLRATAAQLDALLGASQRSSLETAHALLAALSGVREWPRQLRRLQDQSRARRRDALVAHLVHRRALRDPDALFEQMLIDPLVQPCMDTTRLKQATAAVQMLLQRVLEGLEPGAQASDKLRHQWDWMRAYRLWEANRKVWLYPENWLLPELRDDKSPAFEALESSLGEEELTAARADKAFGGFLEEVNRTGQTQVIGMFEDVARDTQNVRTRRDLYIVGRSANPPYTYSWRRCLDFGRRWMEWSPWTGIELDISSDHLLPFVHQGRFNLAWPLITRTPDAAQPKWDIKMTWSAFDGTTWTRIGSSRDEPSISCVAFEDERSGLAFRAHVPPNGAPRIDAYAKLPPTQAALAAPTPKASSVVAFQLPARLLDVDAEFDLAPLLVATHASLPARFKQRLDFWLICRRGVIVTYPGGVGQDTHLVFSESRFRFYLETMDNQDVRTVREALVYDEGQMVSFLLGMRAYASDEYEAGFYSALGTLCSGREVAYRVWARRAGDRDLLELRPDEGLFSLSFDQITASVGPGAGTASSVRGGATPGSRATLRWTPKLGARVGSIAHVSLGIDLDEVRAGDKRVDELQFEVVIPQGTADSVVNDLFMARLGATRAFRHALRFPITLHEELAVKAGDGTSLQTRSDTSVWMNGHREDGASGSLALPGGPSSRRAVFSQLAAAEPFWLVGAGALGQLDMDQTAIWSFREGPASCLVDMDAEPSSSVGASQLGVYPQAWPQGATLSRAWFEQGQLPAPMAQFDDFGAAALPTLAPGAPELPLEVRRGSWCFDNRMPNAGCWWEICFHGPLAIADQLTRQQRFQDADRWLRRVFDPLTSTAADPQAFLRFRRFRSLPRAVGAASDLRALARSAASPDSSPTPQSARVRAGIERWRSQPYRPYVVARQRQVAFLWGTVFAYLENLLAWADSRYRRETRDSIQEAALLYIQAARLLGPRPRQLRSASVRPVSSFIDYQGRWDEFANAWLRELPARPATLAPVTVDAPDDDSAIEGLLYFCMPPNERLIGLWDIVEQRLRNIRNCRTIDGVARTLPIEAPEIDLDELIRSVAAGDTPEDALAEAAAQPWPYRYPTLLAQARDLVNDVKGLGAQLLASLEKRDVEALARLRSTHELALLERASEVRRLQLDEAGRQVQALRTSREAIAARYEQLQRQLGNEGARAPLPNQSTGAESPLGRLSGGNAHAPSQLGLITQEALQLDQMHRANGWSDADSVARLVAIGLHGASAAAKFLPPNVFTKIGEALGSLGTAASSAADGFRAISQVHQTQASRLGQAAVNIRRRDEWAFQSNQALRELATIDKQISAAEARESTVRKELANHELQREQSAATDAFLREKFTGAALYQWQSGQLLTLYRNTYGLALALARRALQAAERELGETLPPIRGQWNAAHSGLLAGEHLQRELKSLELSMLERNTREEEPIRHVSLRRLDPRALVELISEGSCEFEVPEWLFDLDAPGHWLRRIKTVSVSVPCVTGPQTSINARLTLLRSDMRVSPLPGASYLRQPDGDERFETRFHAAESIFISTGREDSGLFETSLRDERYLPFEGAGAIARWRIEFPGEVAQFDRTTISDLVLHLRYTARDGGMDLRRAAATQFEPRAVQPQTLLLSARSDFAAQWAQARQSPPKPLTVEIDVRHGPYWMTRPGFDFKVNAVETWDVDAAGVDERPTLRPVVPSARVEADLGPVGPMLVDRLILATLTTTAPA